MTVEAFLTRFDRKTATGGQWLVKCPGHDDRQASLAVKEGTAGRILLTCHAGCDRGRILHAMDLTDVDLFEAAPRASRREVATYDYPDEHGTLLYQAVRFEPKDFRQRRPDGAGGWLYNVPASVRRVLYRLPEIQGREFVLVCEGEKDVDAIRKVGVPAVCNVGGAGKWRAEYTDQLVAAGVHKVAILPDNDAPGRAHADEVARQCHAAGLHVRVVALPDVPEKGDVSDYLQTHSKVDLFELIKRTAPFDPAASAPVTALAAGPVLVNLGDVQPEPISWLWPGRLAHKKVAIIAGDPGIGKSFITIDIAARITTGRAWPDGERAQEPRNVIFLCAEDGLADTVRPRLDAMGGDPSRVSILQGVRVNRGGAGQIEERAFSLQTDVPHLEQAIQQTSATLVVIDPISNYLGDTDSYRDTEVRQVLTPLALLAERTGVAILLVMHLTKDTKASALYRLNSSIAFGGVARLVLAVGTAPEEANPYVDGAARILANIKQNVQSTPPAVPWSFRTQDNRVEWIAARDDVRPDALFASARAGMSEAQADAEAFLLRFLASGAYQPSSVVEAAAKNENITKDQLFAQRRRLCESKREGYGEGGRWMCRLKPEFRGDPTADTPPIASKIVTPPTVPIYEALPPVNPTPSTTSSLIGTNTIYEPINDTAEEWTEV